MHPIILGNAHESIIISEKSITLPRDAIEPKITQARYITLYILIVEEPNKYQKMLKLGVPTLAVAHKQKVDRIQASDLQNVILKKCKINDSKTKQSDDFRPSLDEIKIALKSLQKTK